MVARVTTRTSNITRRSMIFILNSSSLPATPLRNNSFAISSINATIRRTYRTLGRGLLTMTQRARPTFNTIALRRTAFRRKRLLFNSRQISLTSLTHSDNRSTVRIRISTRPSGGHSTCTATARSTIFIRILISRSLNAVGIGHIIDTVTTNHIIGPGVTHDRVLNKII